MPSRKLKQLLLITMYSDYVDQENTAAVLLKTMLEGQRRQHRFWVHEIIQRRLDQGAYHNLVRELAMDPTKFHDYFRMSAEELETVLSYVGPHLQRITKARKPLTPKERLVICLRYATLFHNRI